MLKLYPQSPWRLIVALLTIAHLFLGCSVDKRGPQAAQTADTQATRNAVRLCPEGEIASAPDENGDVECAKHLANPVEEGISQAKVLADATANTRTVNSSGVGIRALDNLASRIISGVPDWRCFDIGQISEVQPPTSPRTYNVGTYWSYKGGSFSLYIGVDKYCAQYSNNPELNTFKPILNGAARCAQSYGENLRVIYYVGNGVRTAYREAGTCPGNTTTALQPPGGLRGVILGSSGNQRSIRVLFDLASGATWYRIDKHVPGVGYQFQRWVQSPVSSFDDVVTAGQVHYYRIWSWNQSGYSATESLIYFSL